VIAGRVVQQEAHVSLSFVQPDGTDQVVEFVIDTGFTGMLLLPAERVSDLHLARVRFVAIRLADDQIVEVDVYSAQVRWGSSVLDVEVLAAGSRALLGTGLLDGHELRIVFMDGGRVSIRPVLT
jgi:clan AA aspartic protease